MMRIKTLFSLILLILLSVLQISGAEKTGQMYYEIRIYRHSSPEQLEITDNYLRNALIPALHKSGITNVGVFRPVEQDTAFLKMTYVFIPYRTAEQYFEISDALERDEDYLSAGMDFINASYDRPPFDRYESIFMKAFAFMPEMKVYSYSTPVSERIYELRSYESATEAKALKKIHMFNEGGEMKIFEEIGSNAVFYGQVLLGSQKPRLMYMTTYENMKSHDEKWAAFRGHPEWKRLSSLEEYRNTTSKTKAFLLHPTGYSDF